MAKEKKPLFQEGDFLDSYTRSEAIEDGVLTDISELAKEQGFIYPVAISAGIALLVEEAVSKGRKDWKGVVWDILSILRFRCRGNTTNRCDFDVMIHSKYIGKDKLTKMYSLVGPGDDMNPVITIMLPEED